MIVRKGAADIPGLPTSVYGYIELDASWRKSLSTFKDDIARDLEPLIAEVRSQIGEVIEDALHWNKDLKVEWLTCQLANALLAGDGKCPGLIELREERDSRAGEEGRGRERGSSGPKSPSETLEHRGRKPKNDSGTGLRIESDPGREQFVWTEIGDASVVVSFDPDHPHFVKSLQEPLDCPAFFGAIGASFASTLAQKDPARIARIFPCVKGRISEDATQRFVTILDEFTRRTADIRERPTIAQIEKDVLG